MSKGGALAVLTIYTHQNGFIRAPPPPAHLRPRQRRARITVPAVPNMPPTP
jgi:hypothetical protein